MVVLSLAENRGLDENGENDEFAFYTQRFLVLRTPTTMKMAGVTQANHGLPKAGFSQPQSMGSLHICMTNLYCVILVLQFPYYFSLPRRFAETRRVLTTLRQDLSPPLGRPTFRPWSSTMA